MKSLLFLGNRKPQNPNSKEVIISNNQVAARNRIWSLILASLVLGVWGLVLPLRLSAQGPLAPPGAPTPTMKSLDQIEARTPISSLPFTINSSGSYYLTKNLNVSSGNGITISANDVTVDLNGFVISSTAASATGTAILINGAWQNITIANGVIQSGVTESGGSYSGSGFANGIDVSNTSTPPHNVRISRVSVSGCLVDGIRLSDPDLVPSSTVVELCVVHTVGGNGIVASTVTASVATDCGMTAIDALNVSDSRGESVLGTGIETTTAQNCYGYGGQGRGFLVTTASNCAGQSGSSTAMYVQTAQNCYATSQSGSGIIVGGGGLLLNCDAFVLSGSGTAIYANEGSAVLNCLTSANTGGSPIGIFVTANCLIQGNSVNGASIGIYVASLQNRIDSNRVIAFNGGQAFVFDGGNNFFTRNSARNIPGVNQYVINGAGNSWGGIYNISGGGALTTSTGIYEPWANFIY